MERYKQKFKEFVIAQKLVVGKTITDITFEHPKVYVKLDNEYTIYAKPKILIIFYKGKKINVAKNYEKLIGQKIKMWFNDPAGFTIITKDFQFNLDFPTEGGLIKNAEI